MNFEESSGCVFKDLGIEKPENISNAWKIICANVDMYELVVCGLTDEKKKLEKQVAELEEVVSVAETLKLYAWHENRKAIYAVLVAIRKLKKEGE